MDLARDLKALATGRRTTDLRPDEGVDDGDGGSERDLLGRRDDSVLCGGPFSHSAPKSDRTSSPEIP